MGSIRHVGLRIAGLSLVVLMGTQSACNKTSRKKDRQSHAAGRTSSVLETKPNASKAPTPTQAAPAETPFPLNGTVLWHTARIYGAPSTHATIVGYARRGTKIRAATEPNGEGCDGNWYRVPGNGFICTAQGYYIGEHSPLEDPPMPPALDSALPYPYGRVVRNGAPQYWKLPTREEELEAMRVMDQLQSLQATAASPVDAGVPIDASAPSTQTAAIDAGTADAGIKLPDYIRMRMEAGYYVSLDRYEDQEGEEFFRTVRGGYLRASDIVEVEAPPMRGVIIGGGWSLPIGFVWRATVRAMQRETEQSYRYLYDLPRHTPVALSLTSHLHNGQYYVLSRENIAMRRSAVRVAKLRSRPPIIPKGAKWIHINVTEQTLVAYEGETPVFITLVSSGRDEFKTPLGIFSIVSKHVTSTMDDFANSDEAYSIEDVPWVMYFQGSYALHGAFWHNRFGMSRSHGCVNLSPVDARWLFQWSTPELPFGWHGVSSSPTERPGTWVVVDEIPDP